MVSSAVGVVRPYRSEDRDALHDICARTADNGGDSRLAIPDLELAGSVFAEPYPVLEPDLTFVVDDGERAVGYIVGTANTPTFARRFREQWLVPPLIDRYPAPSSAAEPQSLAELFVSLMHDPERLVLPELVDYPAHLHIALLPSHQRSGFGRELMHTFLTALHDKGVQRAHLCMVTANTPARAFYDRLGFHVIDVPDPGPVTFLGRETLW